MPIALIFFTASMKRVTTTGASPSNGSSSSRTDGESAIARATATIFFWPPREVQAPPVHERLDLREDAEDPLLDVGAAAPSLLPFGRASHAQI